MAFPFGRCNEQQPSLIANSIIRDAFFNLVNKFCSVCKKEDINYAPNNRS